LFDRDAIEITRKNRLSELVNAARAGSPFYRELYKGLPERVNDVTLLPVTNKRELMAHYNDWPTDRDVTLDKVQAFVADTANIGKPFLGKYRVAQSSGSTGARLLFVIDAKADDLTEASSKQMMKTMASGVSFLGILKFIFGKPKTAMIIAVGGHTAAYSRHVRNHGLTPDPRRKVLSVHLPIPELVAQLNEFLPDMLQGYASTIALLAHEQEVGRLHIKPAFVLPTSEGLPEREYDRIAQAFHVRVGTAYGGTECGSAVGWSCKYGWIHLNSDWAIVEPVDEKFRPATPGTPSYTTLVTNLANRVEPVIRYDMGDSLLVRPDVCPCRNPMPAIRVLGRVADTISFPTADGAIVKITAMQLSMVMERLPGIQLFQLVQISPTSLRVRMRTVESGAGDQSWERVRGQLGELLRANGLTNVTIERGSEPPEQASGGKYREVIPFAS
jgi:phenylacetate-CoA ligase